MSDLFLQLVNMSIAASYLIIAVIVLRFFLRRAPRWTTMLMWALVGLRLIIPVSITSPISLVPSAQTIQWSEKGDGSFHINSGFSIIDNRLNNFSKSSKDNNINSIATSAELKQNTVQNTNKDHQSRTTENPINNTSIIPGSSEANLPNLLFIIWLTGVGMLILYAVYAYIRVRIKSRISIALNLTSKSTYHDTNPSKEDLTIYRRRIMVSDGVTSPFILGVIKPRIFLPSGIDENSIFYILSHENAHLKRCDHIWKLMAYLVLAIHWFNPLVWISYILLCRDIELACDEKAISNMDMDGRKAYAKALVDCSMQRRLVMVCPLAFGEIGIKERVKKILSYKKARLCMVIAVIFVCGIVGITFLTNQHPAAGEREGYNQNNGTLSNGNIEYRTSGQNETIKYDYDGEKVHVHLDDIALPKETKLFESTAKRMDFSDCAEEINKTFFDMKQAVYSKYNVQDSDGYDVVEYSWLYETPDHWRSYLTVYGPQLYMVLDGEYEYNYFDSCLRDDETYGEYGAYPEEYRWNADAYLGKEIKNFSKDDALKKFTSGMQESGVNIGELAPIALAMDTKTASEQWFDMDHDGTPREKPDFSHMKDTWYFLARQSLQGLPVIYYHNGRTLQLQNVPLRFAVDEDKTEYIAIDRLFEFTQSDKRIGDLLSFEDIIPSVIDRYELLLGHNQYSIEKCGLYYYAFGNGNRLDYEMIPVWAFDVEEINENDSSDRHNTVLMINAVTGEEVENIK